MTLQYDIVDIYDLLYRLGLKATNTAFFYTSYAVYLAAQQPDRLLLLSQWIYPKVSSRYSVNIFYVAHEIRNTAAQVWQNRRAQLEHMAHNPLPDCPTPARFLSILLSSFSKDIA